MVPTRYLTGVVTRSITMEVDEVSVNGFEVQLQFLDVDDPDEGNKLSEPFFVDERSFVESRRDARSSDAH